MRRSFNLFLNLGFSKLSLFSLNAGSNFGNKVSEDPNAIISRRLKIKELGICFLHFLVFPSLHSPQTLSSRPLIARSMEKLPHALGTGMRFPNPCVSLLWSELEVNATCLGKASCLNCVIPYYSPLRTQNLPQGHLSLSLSRTSATRGCWRMRTETPLPWLRLSAAEGPLELAEKVYQRHW